MQERLRAPKGRRCSSCLRCPSALPPGDVRPIIQAGAQPLENPERRASTVKHFVHARYSRARGPALACVHAQQKGDQGDKHEDSKQTFLAAAGGCRRRSCHPGAAGAGAGSAKIGAHRLGHCQDRPQRRRHCRHGGAQLPALGQGDQCRGRHPAQGLRQARAHRGRGIRRPLEHRGGGACHGTPDDPGQGRLRAAALEHGQQPGRGSDLREAQVPAAGRHRGDRQGARAGSMRSSSWARARATPSRW